MLGARSMDLNSDTGESFGPYQLGETATLLPVVTSANVACGFHAGDPRTMAATVALARRHRVGVGAHVGYPDLVGFGRRAIAASSEEIATDVLYQIGALFAFTQAEGVPLRHVKGHGALYNQAVRDERVAAALVLGVARFRQPLALVAPAGSAMAAAAEAHGLPLVWEAFCDRAYRPDGTLVPRTEPDSVLTDPGLVAARAVRLARSQEVVAADGTVITVPCATLCIHGDTAGATKVAARVRAELEAAGIALRPMASPAPPPGG
ncbi:MAG TPA: 5-oxoprolinase subunit PxpA [Candidatus Micrarchaeia archaeon]|nr:5-oxoprolinase subunit PxpA [Candidatus Micrarchaeia archaeon]